MDCGTALRTGWIPHSLSVLSFGCDRSALLSCLVMVTVTLEASGSLSCIGRANTCLCSSAITAVLDDTLAVGLLSSSETTEATKPRVMVQLKAAPRTIQV